MFNHPDLLLLMTEQALQERYRNAAQTHAPADRTAKEPGSIRQTLASYLMRLGLRLDPAAGGGLGASARKEARRGA